MSEGTTAVLSPAKCEMRVTAWFVGTRIETKELSQYEIIDSTPTTVRIGDSGLAVIFRFGAVVLIDLGPAMESEFLAALRPLVSGRFERPEHESVLVEIDSERVERVEPSGNVVLRESSIVRLHVLAHVLSKSTVLAHYEERVAQVFDRVEGLADRLRKGARRAKGRALLREIGNVLQIQARTVGRVEISEKPEITWDDAELDRLYERLAREYELRDRDLALTRKLELISNTARTYLDLLHTRQAIRVEWLIVFLIFMEFVVILYDIFWPH